LYDSGGLGENPSWKKLTYQRSPVLRISRTVSKALGGGSKHYLDSADSACSFNVAGNSSGGGLLVSSGQHGGGPVDSIRDTTNENLGRELETCPLILLIL